MTMTLDNVEVDQTIRLREEYNDLYEEFVDCDDQSERCRCARRMTEIADEIDATE